MILKPPQCQCFIDIHRQGVLSKVGHDIRMRVERFQIELKDISPHITAVFDADSLQVEGVLEGQQASDNRLKDDDRRKIEHKTQHDVLKSNKYPKIRFISTQIDTPTLQGHLILRDAKRLIRASIRRDGEGWRVEARIDQTDFGIEPHRALMGALKVAPELEIVLTVPDLEWMARHFQSA